MVNEELFVVINGCIANDRRYQEILYKHYYKSMFGLVSRYIDCPFIAEEVVNDGYLRIFKCLGQYNYSGSFEGWMRRPMFHAVCNAVKTDGRITTLKKREQGKFLDRSLVVRHDTKSGHEIFGYELSSCDIDYFGEQDLYKMIGRLPKMTSKVFRLFIDGFKHSEISVLLGISAGTSKWHVNQARKYLIPRIVL